MEQILIRNLPDGTKALLRLRAQARGQSLEAEARTILSQALAQPPTTILDILSTSDGADITFEPERLGLNLRVSEL